MAEPKVEPPKPAERGEVDVADDAEQAPEAAEVDSADYYVADVADERHAAEVVDPEVLQVFTNATRKEGGLWATCRAGARQDGDGGAERQAERVTAMRVEWVERDDAELRANGGFDRCLALKREAVWPRTV